jgi:hypothetical protein
MEEINSVTDVLFFSNYQKFVVEFASWHGRLH